MNLFHKLKSYLTQNTSTKQTIIKNTFWLAVAEFFSKWINLILPIFIVRFIWTEQFWIYSFAYTLSAIIYIFSDIWLTQLFIREVSKNHENIKKLFGIIYISKGFLSLITMWIIVTLAMLVEKNIYNQLVIIVLWFVFISNSFVEFIRWIFRWLQKSEFEAKIRLVYGLITLLISIPYIIFFKSILWVAIINLAINIVLLIWLYYYIYKGKLIEKIYHIDLQESKKLIKESYFFALSVVFVMLYYYIDTVILKFFVWYNEIWLYSSAYRILIILIAPASLLVNVLFPVLSKTYYENQKKFKNAIKKLFKLIFIPSLICIPLLIFFSSYIIEILYWKDLLTITSTLQILLWSLFFTYLGSIFGVGLQSSWKQKYYTIISMIWVVINIWLNVILIPRYGINGAAISTFVTEIVISWLYYLYL